MKAPSRALKPQNRLGGASPIVLLLLGAVVLLGVISYVLLRDSQTVTGDGEGAHDHLFMFCAAGMRLPVEQIAAEYERQYGVRVQLQYGGSNTLLSQIEVGKTGDLYLAGDDTYIRLAQERGLVREEIPVARMRPVIAVARGNPKGIKTIEDLLRDDVRVALTNPDQAAVGQKTRSRLQASGHWADLERHVREEGVFKPTVSDVANDIKLGSVDAGIIWDSTAQQYEEIEAVAVPQLDAGVALVSMGVMTSCRQPTTALRFARFLAARDRGLPHFQAHGFQPVDGDVWEEVPELTFFVGSVNRRALETVIKNFARREGVEINTVYNGCGILTAQMRSMLDTGQINGFPDMYMACDVYYLDTVGDLFQDAVNVSNTAIVIVVQKGNPKQIRSLSDLARPGIRVAVGQPEQCTIGVLTKRLLQAEGLYEQVEKNIVTQTATSALLVPNITTASADAVLAYATDTIAERDKLDVVTIDSPLAQAVQPYGIARSSDFKYLGRRLYRAISQSRASFEAAGFGWRLGDGQPGEQPGSSAAAATPPP